MIMRYKEDKLYLIIVSKILVLIYEGIYYIWT